MSLTKVSYSMISAAPVNVIDYIPAGVDTTTTDCSAYVQAAVDYCLASNKDLVVTQLIKLSSSVNIDRLVDTKRDVFTIHGIGIKAGFYSDSAINMFSSTLSDPAFAKSEFIAFNGVYFEASTNAVNTRVLNGQSFLRMRFDSCVFNKIRLALTTNYFQSFYINNCVVQQIKGVFLHSAGGGASPVAGWSFDIHFTDNMFEVSDLSAANSSTMFKLTQIISGSSFISNLYESWSGPFLDCGGAEGLSFTGNYFEALNQAPAVKFGLSPLTYTVCLEGNFFNCSNAAGYYAVDCGGAFNVVGVGNYSGGSLYKTASMTDISFLESAGFGETASYGLISLGDMCYSGSLTDVPLATKFKRLKSEVFQTKAGQVIAPTATPTAIATLSTAGRYEIYAYLDGSVPTAYAATAVVLVTDSANAALIPSLSANGTGLTILVVGMVVYVTQTSGVSQTVTWNLLNNGY